MLLLFLFQLLQWLVSILQSGVSVHVLIFVLGIVAISSLFPCLLLYGSCPCLVACLLYFPPHFEGWISVVSCSAFTFCCPSFVIVILILTVFNMFSCASAPFLLLTNQLSLCMYTSFFPLSFVLLSLVCAIFLVSSCLFWGFLFELLFSVLNALFFMSCESLRLFRSFSLQLPPFGS